jgi:hypothetical protein
MKLPKALDNWGRKEAQPHHLTKSYVKAINNKGRSAEAAGS